MPYYKLISKKIDKKYNINTHIQGLINQTKYNK